LQNHYSYVFNNITNTYNFTTKSNLLYSVAFIVDETFSSISGEHVPNVFQLIIEKVSDEKESFDALVSKTIEHIIESFFKKAENSLIYICSDDAGKAKIRHDIFNRWYKKSVYKEVIVKMDNVINIKISEDEMQTLYTSLFFHKMNPNYKKLITLYNQIEKILNEEK